MSKFTPGPWSIHRTPRGYDHIRSADGKCISHECSDLDDIGDEAKANAVLIAAAPEMAEALKSAWDTLSQVDQHTGITPYYGGYRTMKLVSEVLKKIEGQE